MPSPGVQRLAPVHAAPYRALMLRAYEEHPDAFTTSAAERAGLPITWWEQRLSGSTVQGECIFGAWHQDQLVAVAGLSREARLKARHKTTLFGMYVAPHCRKLGLGQALVQAVLAHARTCEGVRLVQLTVTRGNQAAQDLYERCGFTSFGLEPMAVAVGDGFVDKVHMWCLLNPGDDAGRATP
ncbi:MAG: GNAT family N-acetyltransferase [Ramlibacter sp.]|nr:GNAT family N-acetyltransferase [Ramlibacter sp.]